MPAPSLWSPAPGTACPHVHPWSPQIVLVISRCPWLACGKDSLLSLGMLSLGVLSPQTAAALLWGSAHSLLLTETRPLTLLWTLSTSNQLLLVFDISWENHQEALVVVSPLFLRFPSPSQPCSPCSLLGLSGSMCPQEGPTQCQAVGISLICLTLGSLNLAAFLSNWRKNSGTGIFFPVKCISMPESGYMYNLLKAILRKLQAVAFKFLVCLFLFLKQFPCFLH